MVATSRFRLAPNDGRCIVKVTITTRILPQPSSMLEPAARSH